MLRLAADNRFGSCTCQPFTNVKITEIYGTDNATGKDLIIPFVPIHRRLAIQIIWPKLEAAGMRLGDPPRPEAEVEEIIGPAALKQMRVITEAIITNFDENVQSLQGAFTALRTKLVQLFPKTTFVDFNFDPKSKGVQAKPKGAQPYYYPHGP